ncbi:cytochrome d ubiquinol oxidase subunit II [Nonomuraea endophytica]|uniref:Cytochrome d ubiquinol oxidase subunit II n=1 Tax=Nonomuraea endophytica TaxID=714136 RepID=A0A7W8A551_9ACTN|nr:cytochrome d ubiquinol oxidase subunit II [Nonomuraea endophytica]MBB5079055.1 cytochrome d ubiquinol oxidase subunit II [Nonomuraea endophytica]
MDILWLAILGFLLTGSFILGGYDYGVQLALPFTTREESSRRQALAALGPFFFGNEVWLIGAAGVLFGAFPFLEGTLLSGAYPLIVALLLGLVAGKSAVQLRGRTGGAAGRRVWDVLLTAGGLIPAMALGMLIGLLLTGVPLRGGHSFTLSAGEVLHPFVLLCGLTTVLLFAAHGGAFLALRAVGQVAARGAAFARRAAAWAALAAVVTAAAGLTLGIRPINAVPINAAPAVVAAIALPVLLTGARAALAAARPGLAFAATSAAAGLPVVSTGLANYPYLLVSSVTPGAGLTLAESAADGATLQMLTGFGVVIVPVILGYQFFLWWAFRGRVARPDYF